ncbi:MAG TPA: serine/threonine-protein kinase, partial [Aggregatilineales bacterium]|nr:serine/threonine-protein kinase [Aggregatilineales bacterium]
PLSEALPLLRDVGGALDYAHQQGIVHRDVKPSNVMLQPTSPLQPTDNTCRAILTDFGIAKIVSGATGLTGTGTMGTLDYIAPEQILNSSAVDAGADIYALGVISYQLLTGQLPFAGTNPAAIIFGHLQAPVPDPRQHVPTIPGRAVNAITRAMAKEPRKRFAAAGEFVAALS